MYYQKHVFFCINQKASGKKCCSDANAHSHVLYAKERLKELNLYGPGKIRVSQSGCLGRCPDGPCVVIYPEGIWYTYTNNADIDEIIEEQLLHNRSVPRLLMDKDES